jgi:carbon starvation protein
MFGMFISKASALTVTSQAFVLYLDAVLVGLVALLGTIVLGDSMMKWYGYVVLKRPFTSSEVIATAGGGSAGRVQTTVNAQDGFQLPGGGCC